MLQNAYFLAKIGADTAENEQHFAEILPKIGNYPTNAHIPAAVQTTARGKVLEIQSDQRRIDPGPHWLQYIHVMHLESKLLLIRTKRNTSNTEFSQVLILYFNETVSFF